jgi:hypothetical protein
MSASYADIFLSIDGEWISGRKRICPLVVNGSFWADAFNPVFDF